MNTVRTPQPAPFSPCDTQAPGLAALLTAVFQQWNQHGIVFLILRNYENLPAATANDVDVLVAPEQLRSAETVMISAAGKCGYLLHNRVEFACVSCFFFHPESLRQIQIDLVADVKWHTFEMVCSSALLDARQPRGVFWIPYAPHEAVVSLLTRLIYHGYVKENYKPAILVGFQANLLEAQKLLQDPFGRRLAALVADLVLREQWADIEKLRKPLRRTLVARRFLLQAKSTFLSVLDDAIRVMRRWLRPPGLMIAVLGADGSGKSTASDRVVDNLELTFNPGKMLRVHWKPVVFFKSRRKPTGLPNVNPHARPPRNPAISFLYLCAHWLEFFLGAQLQFRPALFRNGLVLVDRYWYDFLVDQRRYRLRVARWIVRLLFACIKKPDLVFLFDAPPEVLQSRKKEVPLEETARQVAAYRELVIGLAQGHILDASRPIELVAKEMTRRILVLLHERNWRSHQVH